MPYFPEKGDAIFGQEDCLFLNVYSPNPSSDAKLPVMVFVHGGGFLMGQATSNMYGPEYFMDHNVVLVTIQYRLGVLGFLSFGNAEVPGNLGMKDQVLALQWIQENIEEFGGNPDSVTIFGESAGAASVSYHLVSPLSKGLFHRAILQSGTASCSWASTPAWLARDRAHAFATLVGCPTQPIETVLDCLRQLPTETFVTTLNKFHIWFKNPMITFAPVIESPLSQNNFLPDHPLRLPHADVPIIIGVNNKEGGIVGAVYCTDDFKLTHQLNADFDRLLPLIVSCNWLPKDKRAEFVQKVKSFYLNNQPVGEDNLEGLIDLVSDLGFFQGAVDTALHHSGYAPAFFYLYDYELPVSLNSMFGNCSQPLGVGHGDELFQLFRMSVISNYTHTPEEVTASNMLLRLWTSFARNGIPDHTAWGPVPSRAVTSREIEYLYVSRSSVSIHQGFVPERIEFASALISEYMNYGSNDRRDESRSPKTEL